MILCFLLLTAPAQAAPRYSAHLDHLSAPEVVRQLETYYGRPMTLSLESKTGAGAPGLRSTFDWENASLGQVIGDVERAFRLEATCMPDGSIHFSPAAAGSNVLTANTERMSVTLQEVRQSEVRRKLIGAGTTDIERSLRLTLAVRPKDGEPDGVRGLAALVLFDDRGAQRGAMATRLAPVSSGVHPCRPDEVRFQVELPAAPAGTPASLRVEGQVVVSRSTRTYRTEFSGPGFQARSGRADPVQVEAMPIVGAAADAVTLRVRSPEELGIQLPPGVSPPGFRCFLRERDGTITGVAGSSIQSQPDPTASGITQVKVTLPPGLAGDETLVCDVTTVEPQELRIPFRFTRVPLPQNVPERPRPSVRK